MCKGGINIYILVIDLVEINALAFTASSKR